MPGAKGQKAKVSVAGKGKALSSILEPLDTQSTPSATKGMHLYVGVCFAGMSFVVIAAEVVA